MSGRDGCLFFCSNHIEDIIWADTWRKWGVHTVYLGGGRLFQTKKQEKVQRQECAWGFQEMAKSGVSMGGLRF